RGVGRPGRLVSVGGREATVVEPDLLADHHELARHAVDHVAIPGALWTQLDEGLAIADTGPVAEVPTGDELDVHRAILIAGRTAPAGIEDANAAEVQPFVRKDVHVVELGRVVVDAIGRQARVVTTIANRGDLVV